MFTVFRRCVCVCVNLHLTLSASAAYLPEHGSLTQPVESLLADQLEQLWLQALFEFTGKKHNKNKMLHHIVFLLFVTCG